MMDGFDSKQPITAKLPPAHVAEESIRPGEWHPFAVRNSALRHFDRDGNRTVTTEPEISPMAVNRRTCAKSARAFVSCWTGARCSERSSSLQQSSMSWCWSVCRSCSRCITSVSAYTIFDPTWQFVGLKNFARSSKTRSFSEH